MSQHDFDIANQAGAAFRADLNNALQALASSSSGASGPGTTYPYQLWADTTNGYLKIRNAANTGWVTLFALATDWGTVGRSVLTATSDATARDALGMPGGVIIDRAYAEYTTNANLTTVIPVDDTVPQNTEGTQVLSVSLTPKSTTSRIRLRFQGFFTVDTNGASCTAAVFSSASSSALRASVTSAPQIGYPSPVLLEHEYVPGTTSALTFSVRVGPQSGTLRLNGGTAARMFGGVAGATLIVEEIAP